MKISLIFSILLALFLTGCGVSKETKASVDNVTKRITETEKQISQQEKAFIASPLTKEMDFYVKKDNMMNHFKTAKDTVAYAKQNFNTKIKPLLEKDSSDDEATILNYIGQTQELLRKSVVEAQYPQTRLAMLKDIEKNKESFYSKAKKANEETSSKFVKFNALAEKAKKEYPAKEKDLTGRISTLKTLNDTSSKAMAFMETEHKKDKMELSDFAKSYDEVISSNKTMITESENQTKKVNQLFHSYSKILVDMKEHYFVKVGRVSWDETSDYDNENTYIYPAREISQKEFEYFDTVAEQEMGSYSGGWMSSNTLTSSWNSAYVNSLRINPTENFPSGDTDANFWLEELYSDGYHKYVIIEDGKKKETGWEKVSEEEFDKQFNNLGMEIVSKPYGMYDDEVIKNAAPAGMSMVGNTKYGEWKQDSSGNSFWHYYGMYSFMNDILGAGSHYSRNDWNGYNSNRNRDYYGSNNNYGTYGSSTYRKGSRYERTDFARKNKSDVTSARSASHGSSIRGAGHTARGRGPGGGGK